MFVIVAAMHTVQYIASRHKTVIATRNLYLQKFFFWLNGPTNAFCRIVLCYLISIAHCLQSCAPWNIWAQTSCVRIECFSPWYKNNTFSAFGRPFQTKPKTKIVKVLIFRRLLLTQSHKSSNLKIQCLFIVYTWIQWMISVWHLPRKNFHRKIFYMIRVRYKFGVCSFFFNFKYGLFWRK